jgi:hypothetical protein
MDKALTRFINTLRFLKETEHPMQLVSPKASFKAVSDHIELSATRRETLAWLAFMVIQQGAGYGILWPIADHAS